MSAPPNLDFVACIEGGVLESQALLLFDSIRRYAGRFRDCPIYALSPRKVQTISPEGRRRLDVLRVTYSDTVLNVDCPHYGSANRVAAAAHIERTRSHDVLVVLDSDTLFLREPGVLLPEVDAAARPADLKGISTRGRDDVFDVASSSSESPLPCSGSTGCGHGQPSQGMCRSEMADFRTYSFCRGSSRIRQGVGRA